MWSNALYRLRWILLYGHTSPLRLLLGIASLCWAALLFAPGETFLRPLYPIMAHLASEPHWAAAFAVHGLFVLWLLINPRPYPVLAVVTHTIGLMLFSASGFCLFLARPWPLPASAGVDLSFALAALWVLIRNALNGDADDPGKPRQR